MIKFKTKQGYTVFKTTLTECIEITGGYGICDMCNTPDTTLYIIPVLNSAYCEKCYKDWRERTREYYEEDRDFEEHYIKSFEEQAERKGIEVVEL